MRKTYTNFYKVNDEEKYNKLLSHLHVTQSYGGFSPMSKMDKRGKELHGLYTYGPLVMQNDDGKEVELNAFFKEMQTLLPVGEALIWVETTDNDATAIIVTKDIIESMNLFSWLKSKARENDILGDITLI